MKDLGQVLKNAHFWTLQFSVTKNYMCNVFVIFAFSNMCLCVLHHSILNLFNFQNRYLHLHIKCFLSQIFSI